MTTTIITPPSRTVACTTGIAEGDALVEQTADARPGEDVSTTTATLTMITRLIPPG